MLTELSFLKKLKLSLFKIENVLLKYFQSINLNNLMNSGKHGLNIVLNYELNDLVKYDIPYFFHYPSELAIYDRNEKEYFDRNKKILINVLNASMPNIKITSEKTFGGTSLFSSTIYYN